MAFYKRAYNKSYNVYYPTAVTVGKPVETKEIAEELAAISTVSRSDVNAVLGNLAHIMAKLMKNGKSVHLNGLGYFRYKLKSKGVSSLDDFDFDKQLESVVVQFTTEKTRNSDGSFSSELIGTSSIEWIELSSSAKESSTEEEEEASEAEE